MTRNGLDETVALALGKGRAKSSLTVTQSTKDSIFTARNWNSVNFSQTKAPIFTWILILVLQLKGTRGHGMGLCTGCLLERVSRDNNDE